MPEPDLLNSPKSGAALQDPSNRVEGAFTTLVETLEFLITLYSTMSQCYPVRILLTVRCSVYYPVIQNTHLTQQAIFLQVLGKRISEKPEVIGYCREIKPKNVKQAIL